MGRLVPIVYEELRGMAHGHLAEWCDAPDHGTRPRDIPASPRGQKARRGQARLSLSDALATEDRPDDFASDLVERTVELDELSTLNPRHARVEECRFFAGMSVEEAARALEVSERTVKHDWTLARAWLYRRLRGEGRALGVP